MILNLLVFAAFAATAKATNCQGCTPLDELSFDKVIAKFKATLVKFDTAFPYGDKHDEYAKVAVSLADINDVLVAEVGIKDYGEKDNEKLAKRFNVKKEDYPVVYLFANDNNGKLHEYRFGKSDEFSEANLKSFIKQQSGIYLPLPGCLEKFDAMAATLMTASTAGDKGKIMAKAEKALESASEAEKAKADIYIKIMRKVVKEGDRFPETEMTRVKKVMDGGKVSEEKKKLMNQRLNVLRSFLQTKSSKDEL